MGKIELKSRSEKLIYVRQILNVTQKDLAGETLTREFISMVESEKRNMSKDVAITIMKNAINYAKERGIPLDLDEEFIARTKEEDLCKMCDELPNTTENMAFCDEIMAYAEENDYPWAKIMVTKKIGNILFVNKEISKAYEKYILCLNMIDRLNSNKYKESIYMCIGNVKFEMIQYEEALTYYNEALNYCYINNIFRLKNNIEYNIALTLHSLGEFDKSLKKIDDILIEKIGETLHLKFQLLKGSTYMVLDKLDEALNIYMAILNNNEIDESFKSLIYNNMALCYMDKGEYADSNKYFELAMISAKFVPNETYKILIEKGELTKRLGKYKEAKKIFNEGMKLMKGIEDYKYELKYIKQLYNIAVYENNYEEMIRLIMEVSNIAKNNELKDEIIWSISELVKCAKNTRDLTILNYI